jgi:MinD superfamily P-loop ATPase
MERKIVGIISGKGGVGKTSLTASLAHLASKDSSINPIILDCDVDAPNLAIILPASSEDEIQTKEVFTTLKASFLEDKCVHCKQCIKDHYCEFNSLSWDEENEIPIIEYLACEGCGACKVLCSEHAFKIEPVKSGEIISYTSKMEFPLVLIDGPPGIGCPVIATVSGLDYIITITEPTPSGLHDLIRAIEVIEQFNLPFGIIVNKYDIFSDFREKFETFIKNTGYDILGKIPFDLSIPEAMSFAKPVVEYAPESKASISIFEIFARLKSILWIN